MALFSGIDHVQVTAHMADVTAFVSGSKVALGRDYSQMCGPDDIQLGTKYVILMPLHFQEGSRRCMCEFIRERLSDLQYVQHPSEGCGDLP